jgi:hypothetical protein
MRLDRLLLMMVVSLLAGLLLGGPRGSAATSRSETDSAMPMVEGYIAPPMGSTRSLSLVPPEVLAESLIALPDAYLSYSTLADDHETLTLKAPSEWADIDTGPWIVQGEVVGTFIAVSADLERFYEARPEWGVFMAASRTLAEHHSVDQLLTQEMEAHSPTECGHGFPSSYVDPFHEGELEYDYDCAKGGAGGIIVVAKPSDRQVLILL